MRDGLRGVPRARGRRRELAPRPCRRGARRARGTSARPSGRRRRRATSGRSRALASQNWRKSHAISGAGGGVSASRAARNGVALVALPRSRQGLAERPVRDAVAVGEAATPERRDPLGAACQLGGEPRLPDPRRSRYQRDAHARPSTARLSDLRSAASSRLRPTSGASSRRSNAGATGAISTSRNALHGLALTLDLEHAERLESRRVVDQPCGDLTDDDLVRGGRLLELRRDADRLSGDEALTRVGRRRDDLARLDADPDLEPDAVVRGRAAR